MAGRRLCLQAGLWPRNGGVELQRLPSGLAGGVPAISQDVTACLTSPSA